MESTWKTVAAIVMVVLIGYVIVSDATWAKVVRKVAAKPLDRRVRARLGPIGALADVVEGTWDVFFPEEPVGPLVSVNPVVWPDPLELPDPLRPQGPQEPTIPPIERYDAEAEEGR